MLVTPSHSEKYWRTATRSSTFLDESRDGRMSGNVNQICKSERRVIWQSHAACENKRVGKFRSRTYPFHNFQSLSCILSSNGMNDMDIGFSREGWECLSWQIKLNTLPISQPVTREIQQFFKSSIRNSGIDTKYHDGIQRKVGYEK